MYHWVHVLSEKYLVELSYKTYDAAVLNDGDNDFYAYFIFIKYLA